MDLRIDLNADIAEERGDDAAIFPYLSSANIACGAHAGGVRVMDAALTLARTHSVTVGAHVSYADRANFGRLPMSIDREPLAQSLIQQIQMLRDRAARFGLTVQYVKPHGALYHQVGVDVEHASALRDAVIACDPTLELLVPFSPMLASLAQPLRTRHEFFADRAYQLSGKLVSRAAPGAHIQGAAAIVQRTLHWLATGDVDSIEGKPLRIWADSICLHGDSPGAVESARGLHAGLVGAGYRIANWRQP